MAKLKLLRFVNNHIQAWRGKLLEGNPGDPMLELKSRIRFLDGIRAVACTSIFALHFSQILGLEDRFQSASLRRLLEYDFGVSIFILISGALIERDLVKIWTTPSRYASFLSRKFVKIAPLYYLTMFSMVAILILGGAGVSLPGLISHVFFLHNLSDIFLYGISPPFWYLAIQMQAYILLPLVGYFVSAKKFGDSFRRGYLILLSFLCAVGFAKGLGHGVSNEYYFGRWVESNPMCVSHSLMAHLPNFLVGMSIRKAFLEACGTSRGWGIISDVWIVICSAFLLFVSMSTDEACVGLPYARYGYPLMLFPLALILCMVPRSFIVKWVLERPLFQWLGLISFSFYLVHYACIKFSLVFFRKIGVDVSGVGNVTLFCMISFLVSLSVAAVLHRIHLKIDRFIKKRLSGNLTG